jgi:hypothetical protein
MKTIQTFSTFKNYSMINEALPEKEVLKEIRSILYEEKDKDDVESLFLNLRDQGFDLTEIASAIEESPMQREISGYLNHDMWYRVKNGDYTAGWFVQLEGEFADAIETIVFVGKELEKIQKRCKRLTLSEFNNSPYLINSQPKEYSYEFSVKLYIYFDISPKNIERIKELIIKK